MAIGSSSNATGGLSIAVGNNSIASGLGSVALGGNTDATQDGATAIGRESVAGGIDSVVLGRSSGAIATNAAALGSYSFAGFANSTAIGVSATTTRENQMALGTASNTYTAAGITSAASKAVQSGPLEIVTTDSQGNLASATPAQLGFASAGDFQALRADLDRTTEGVAMAMALTGIPNVLPDSANYAVSANWGGFGGESALAIGGSARVFENLFLSGGGAFGTGGRSSGGGRAGFTYAW